MILWVEIFQRKTFEIVKLSKIVSEKKLDRGSLEIFFTAWKKIPNTEKRSCKYVVM